MSQIIYHLVGHKIVDKTLFIQALLFSDIEILRKMYEKIKYHRMN